MVSPQEARFARLAVERKALTREQLKQCLEFQSKKKTEGSKIPLWDSAVLQNMVEQDVAEELQEDAGDLDVEKLGSFAILRKLGQGGIGSVWLATTPKKERVAVKVLPVHLAGERSFLTRFFREAQASIKLQHKNIIRGIEVGEAERNYYFAMEFVDGVSVRDMIRDSGFVPADKATDIIMQTAEGLVYAHENGVIHRDIKPDNIMVTKDGTAKLADLGLARQTDQEMTRLTGTGTSMGTPHYMAPEQCRDAKRADARSDVYSLGMTWFHMVTGQTPFQGSTPLEVMLKHEKEPLKWPAETRARIPKGVMTTIERMTAKDPDNRIQTTADVIQTIKEQCLGERDLLKDLGIKEDKSEEVLWDLQVSVLGRQENRRLSGAEVKKAIQEGTLDRETPARRGGTRSPFRPAGEVLELSHLFPARPKAAAPRMKGDGPRGAPARHAARPAQRTEDLHTLVSQYGQAEKSYRRKKTTKKMVRLAVKLAVVVVIAALGYFFWPNIKGLAAGLLKSREPDEGTGAVVGAPGLTPGERLRDRRSREAAASAGEERMPVPPPRQPAPEPTEATSPEEDLRRFREVAQWSGYGAGARNPIRREFATMRKWRLFYRSSGTGRLRVSFFKAGYSRATDLINVRGNATNVTPVYGVMGNITLEIEAPEDHAFDIVVQEYAEG